MLLTYHGSCEKLAKGEIMKIGLVKETILKRERLSLSLLNDERLGSNPSFHRDLACQLNDVST